MGEKSKKHKQQMRVITNFIEINAMISITALNMNHSNKLTKDRDYWNGLKRWIKKLFF